MLPTTQFPGRECINWQPDRPETDEAYGQQYGHIAILPNWKVRITLRLGNLFITIGKKLVTEAQAAPRLSEETM